MIWPDIVMMGSGVVFCAALVPQIIKNYKQKSAEEISWGMLILYLIGIIILGVGFAGLGVWGSFVTNAICFCGYLIIAIQKIYYERK